MAENSRVLKDLLPDLLTSQLVAAEVYAMFVKYSEGREREVWWQMLREELAHVNFVSRVMEQDDLPEVDISEIRLDAIKHVAREALAYGGSSAYQRVLWGLRLEHAEIDFGLEALTLGKLSGHPDVPVYTSPLRDHYEILLSLAERYRAAQEISMQVARIREHLPE